MGSVTCTARRSDSTAARSRRAEGQFAGASAAAGIGDIVEQPANLACREIGIDHQPRFLLDHRGVAVVLELVAETGGSPVLPDDGVMNRPAGLPIPEHRGFALVGDADGGDLADVDIRLLEHLLGNAELDPPDLIRIVLDPAGLGKSGGTRVAPRRARFPGDQTKSRGNWSSPDPTPGRKPRQPPLKNSLGR